MRTHNETARLAAGDEDYARFKLSKDRIEQWEDGLRLDPGAPNLEWWYFDCPAGRRRQPGDNFLHEGCIPGSPTA